MYYQSKIFNIVNRFKYSLAFISISFFCFERFLWIPLSMGLISYTSIFFKYERIRQIIFNSIAYLIFLFFSFHYWNLKGLLCAAISICLYGLTIKILKIIPNIKLQYAWLTTLTIIFFYVHFSKLSFYYEIGYFYTFLLSSNLISIFQDIHSKEFNDKSFVPFYLRVSEHSAHSIRS